MLSCVMKEELDRGKKLEGFPIREYSKIDKKVEPKGKKKHSSETEEEECSICCKRLHLSMASHF